MIDENEVRELVAVAQHGYQFREYAASQLISLAGCWGNCRYEILLSVMARGFHEWPNVFQLLADWKAQDRMPSREVSKFIPGDHYHVADRKFDTLEAAQEYIRSRGWRYAGLTEKHVYSTSGD